MNLQRLQALALILSAVCLLLGLAAPGAPGLEVITAAGIVLFMFGIPAVNAAQPSGWVGLAGVLLLELAALIALGFRLDVVPSGLGSSLSETSALLGMLGALITGWVTIGEHVFPAWVGWAFLVQGLLNTVAGLFKPGLLAGAFPLVLALLYVAALFGYGYFLYAPRQGNLSRANR